MKEIQVVKLDQVEPSPLIGVESESAGWLKRVIYPQNVNVKGILMGVAEINPGHSPHRWHTHTTDITESYQTIYDDNFEEVYYIIKGTGVVQWIKDDGSIAEQIVNTGDSIFFPIGVPKHQLLNNSNEKMTILYAGGPPVKFIPSKK